MKLAAIVMNNQRNNDDDIHNILSEAQCHYKSGQNNYRNKNYDQAITEFKDSLVRLESVWKRHDLDIAAVYHMLGNCYYEKNDYENAIAAYRKTERLYAKTGRFDCFYRRRLDDYLYSVLTEDQQLTTYYRSTVMESVQFEQKGDMYRKEGDFFNAKQQYIKAIELEINIPIGNTIILTYLYRKIAQLILLLSDVECEQRGSDTGSSTTTTTTTTNTMTEQIDWKYIDCFNNDENKPFLLDNIYRAVKIQCGVMDFTPILTCLAIKDGENYHIQHCHKKELKCYEQINQIREIL